ncbi:MAG: calcium-binding protein [Sulfitobacter sp.]
MVDLRLTDAQDTGFEITERHFGGNIIASKYTDDGRAVDSFLDAVDELDISDLRYPAGQPDAIYADGLLINGQLPDHVHAFFASVDDRPGQVVMVTPTFEAYGGATELERFAQLVLEQYGDKVRSFEIGNEYWQEQGEAEYGTIANDSALAINNAIQTTGIDANIWVQMANASGAGSDFHAHPSLGWIDRTIEANKTIIDQLSPEVLETIDALVEHSYLRDTNQLIGDEIDATNMLWLDIHTWQDHAGREFDLALTEWNIRTSNEEQLGVKAASSLLHHFENLIQLGADEMHVWSPQHNSATDLAGSDFVIVDEDTGVVKNTVTGAAYDLMSSNLVGKNLFDVQVGGADDYISTHAYANDHEATIYVASRSEDVETISFSLGDVFEGAVLSTATLVGYDDSADSSDGIHWFQPEERFVESDYVIVEGERYYLDEHDAQAAIDRVDIGNAAETGTFSFELKPYQVIELTYGFPNGTSVVGTNLDDRQTYDAGAQYVRALEGNDTVNVGIDADTVYGGDGNDHIILGADNDYGSGDAGDDFLSGWGGEDTLTGGEGQDTLYGFQGNDYIDGNVGNDDLRGDDGDDVILGSAGFDTLNGGIGADRLYGGANADHLIGGAGNDTLSGGDGFDRLEAGDGDDVLDGGASTDALFGGIGNDAIFGGDDNDRALGGAGFDTINGDDGNDTILGEGQADVLSGGNGNDEIYGGSGVDQLIGGTGDDLLDGGIHNDRLRGGEGQDTLIGSAGFDFLEGEEGDDVLYGGNEADRMTGGAGNDTVLGQNGQDYLFAGNQDDYVDGGADNDTVIGGHGDDTVLGDSGNDRILGGTGNDTIEGGTGNDTIFAGAGFDTIEGGTGNDELFGNFNADTFVFADGHGQDEIVDFEAANFAEVIDFRGISAFSDFAGLRQSMRQEDNDVVITTDAQSSVRIRNTDIEELDENDFVF